MRKLLLFAVSLAVLAPAAPAQDVQESFTILSSQRRPVQVWAGAGYQQFSSDGYGISQLSVPLGVRVPIGRNTQAQLTISQASVAGDELTALNGLSDAQLSVSHARRLGDASLVGSIGVGLPTGTSGLEADEFATSVEMGRNSYAFSVPGFGQGTSVAPSIVLALPLNDDFVAGLGTSYLYRGGYEPMAGMANYDAGDELLFTAGLSYRLDRVTALSADLTYTRYGTDRIDGEEVFASGDKTTLLAQYRRHESTNRIHVYGLHRTRAVSQYRLGEALANDESKTPPSQSEVCASYGRQLKRSLWGYAIAGGRIFGDTPTMSGMTLFQAGIMPEVQLSSTLSVGARVLATFGDLQGLEVGTRLTARL